MKYPVILKYTFFYICSGNFYKPATSEYYQVFTNLNESRMVTIKDPVYEKVNLEEYSDNEIKFSYEYTRYLYPDTFVSDSELIKESYVLKPGEKESIVCVYKYWAYAKGAENGPARLTVEWISYEDFIKEIIEKSKENEYSAIDAAAALIKEEMYDVAYNMLLGTKKYSYELGLCYEKGYGTEIDLDKALENYIYDHGYDRDRGIERIFKARGKEITLDEVKETMIYLSIGDYLKAYSNAIIPTEKSDNTFEEMRTNVELNVIKFLELGRPFNDPFGHRSDNMSKLATYYDVINNVNKDEIPQYHTIVWEDDPYDGGEFRHDLYDDKLIVETLQNEAIKNDVIALGCLLVQFGIHPTSTNFSSYLVDNLNEILQRLVDIAENSNDKESGMAYYFLGLYYERIAKKALENYDKEYFVRNKKYTFDGDNIEKDIEIYLQENDIELNDNLIELVNKLNNIYNRLSEEKEKDHINKLENFIIYLYNKNYDKLTKMEKENLNIARKYFELSLDKGFHLAIAHLAEKIVEEHSEEEALKILKPHKKYIPYIRDCCAGKYHNLLEKLKKE